MDLEDFEDVEPGRKPEDLEEVKARIGRAALVASTGTPFQGLLRTELMAIPGKKTLKFPFVGTIVVLIRPQNMQVARFDMTVAEATSPRHDKSGHDRTYVENAPSSDEMAKTIHASLLAMAPISKTSPADTVGALSAAIPGSMRAALTKLRSPTKL